jgi:hypothetical protein
VGCPEGIHAPADAEPRSRRVTPESSPSPWTILALLALAALAASLVLGGLFRRLWTRHEQRTIQRKWQERERLLDSRRSVAASPEIFEWHPRPARRREDAQSETAARMLYIVARDQPDLFAFLRRDFAAEQSEGAIEILMNRRQRMQPCAVDGRDPRRNRGVSVDLREMGFVLVRQQPDPTRPPSTGDRSKDYLPGVSGAFS